MNKPGRSYSVIIPTKTYLRKFICSEHGHPLDLNYNTTLGTLILCMLEKDEHSINMNNRDKESRIQFMNDTIEVTALVSTMRFKGFSLSKDKIIAINRYIENSFVESLHRYCKFHIKDTNWRPGIKDAIYAFADSHGIDVEIDISFEALKKAEFRHKKKLEKKSMKTLQRFVPANTNPLQSLFSRSLSY